MGLQVLYPSKGAGSAEVINADIVAVHGLYGDAKNTWTSRQTNAFWLTDFLPHDVPNARVMTFGYNAHVAFGKTTADIIDHAKSLLSSLIDKREEDDELRRPIIFIGHSLGGIVVKQALFQATIEQRYNSISESTVGIIFLGTPHRGSDKAPYGKVLATLATAVLNKPPPRLVNALQVNSEALMRLSTDFRFQLPKYQVYSFYELKPMKMLSTLVVEKHSALLDIEGEEQIPVDADHEEICKFIRREDDVYEKLFKRIRRMIKKQDCVPQKSSYVCSPSPYNKHYYVPHNLSAIFTGRDEVIQKMSKVCLPSNPENRQKRFVLYGLGGSGKTQACIKFAQDYRERFWGIFWIDASSHITAQQGFLELSRIFGVDEDPKAVRQWLSNIQDHWLLIIDNADDPSIDVSEFFPKGNRGSILLTTRNPHCKIHSTVGLYELGQMNMNEAVTLLLKAAGAEDAADEVAQKKAIPVTQTLGFLALAIVQAGAYIQQGHCDIEEYCDVYTRRRQRLLKQLPIQTSSDYKYSVYTTWEISMEAIERICSETSRNAIELIRIFCFLHYDGITEEIFEQAWSNSYKRGGSPQDIAHIFYMHPQKEVEDWDPVMIREAAVLLASFSLIKIDKTGRRLSMHPLVHVWARDRLSKELQRRSWVTASSTLAATMSWEFQLTDFRFRRSLLLHINSCISFCRDELFLCRYSELNRVDMAEGFALSFQESGRLQEAMELRGKVLEARQSTLGNEHPDTLTAMANFAASYSSLGRRQDAMELREKVLEARQRTLGSKHPLALLAIAELARSYSDLGRSRDAMELEEKVLEAWQRMLGNEHPRTLLAIANLAGSYSDLGRSQDAMELQEKVLEARQRTLGNEHPDTLMAMANLAASYRNLGHSQDAMELQEKVLEASQRTLGNEHPDTLLAMGNLARSYNDLGRRQDAMDLEKKVLEASQRTLGNEHPHTLLAMGNLARSYSDLGCRQDAMNLEEKVLEASQRTLGNEHPHTLLAMGNLAASYSNLGRSQDVMKLEEKVLEARQRTLGNEHPRTLLTMGNLAASYSDLGRSQDAMELSEKVLEASQRTLGNEHPRTLLAMANLAINYSNLGRRQDAMELEEKVLGARQRTLGNEHPDTLLVMANLAGSYSNLGRRQDAMELEEKVLEAKQRTLGSEHPDTLFVMGNLARSYSHLGRSQDAMELEEKVLEARQRTLGNEHPHTLLAMANLASSYGNLGRRQDAMELQEKVLEARQRTMGNEHPDTLKAMADLAASYSDLGRRQDAMELREKVLEARQKTLGSEHPDTLRAMTDIADMTLSSPPNRDSQPSKKHERRDKFKRWLKGVSKQDH